MCVCRQQHFLLHYSRRRRHHHHHHRRCQFLRASFNLFIAANWTVFTLPLHTERHIQARIPPWYAHTHSSQYALGEIGSSDSIPFHSILLFSNSLFVTVCSSLICRRCCRCCLCCCHLLLLSNVQFSSPFPSSPLNFAPFLSDPFPYFFFLFLLMVCVCTFICLHTHARSYTYKHTHILLLKMHSVCIVILLFPFLLPPLYDTT